MKSLALVLLALPLAGLSRPAARTVVPVAPGADVQRALDAAPDGAEIRFAAGNYPIVTELVVTNRRDLLIRGETGTRFVIRFEPVDAKRRSAQGFVCRGLKGIAFEKISFTTDRPINCSGTVVAVDAANDRYDVLVDEGFPLDARQVLAATDTVTAGGMPDGILQSYHDTPYEIVGERTMRVRGPRRPWSPKWRYSHYNQKEVVRG